jgi:hypothetical protein
MTPFMGILAQREKWKLGQPNGGAIKWSQLGLRWAGMVEGNGLQWPKESKVQLKGPVEIGDTLIYSDIPGVAIKKENPGYEDFVMGTALARKETEDIVNGFPYLLGKQCEGLKEKDFTDWIPGTTLIQKIINDLSIKSEGRIRLLSLPPKSCYSYHKDGENEWRLHIPLQTNKHSFLVIDNQTWHLPVGYAYMINTSDYHTAMNCGTSTRVHLVASYSNLTNDE